MIKIQTQENNPITVIRAATGNELTDYEKKKLADIEELAQKNKLEVIKINGKRVDIDKETKTAQIAVGDLAFKSTVSPDDLDGNKWFFIKCELDESDVGRN